MAWPRCGWQSTDSLYVHSYTHFPFSRDQWITGFNIITWLLPIKRLHNYALSIHWNHRRWICMYERNGKIVCWNQTFFMKKYSHVHWIRFTLHSTKNEFNHFHFNFRHANLINIFYGSQCVQIKVKFQFSSKKFHKCNRSIRLW